MLILLVLRLEVMNPGTVTKFQITATTPTSSPDKPDHTVCRIYSEMELLNGRKIIRRDSKSHLTCTMYELEDFHFKIIPGMTFAVAAEFNGTGDKNITFCIKVI